MRLECIGWGGHSELCLLVGGQEGARPSRGLVVVCDVCVVFKSLGAHNVVKGMWDHLFVAQEPHHGLSHFAYFGPELAARVSELLTV